MKIAVPTRDNVVDSHFGHCESYTIYTIDNNKEIIEKETLPSPQGCGCKSNIASALHEKGVSIMLAGNMGDGALNVLNHHGITIYRGCSGNTEQLVKLFLSEGVKDSGEGCHVHDNGHICNHHY